jgi:hypothetical protein
VQRNGIVAKAYATKWEFAMGRPPVGKIAMTSTEITPLPAQASPGKVRNEIRNET